MKHLLALLDTGTLGTPAEPSTFATARREKVQSLHGDIGNGTRGTHGTLQIAAPEREWPMHVAALVDAYAERLAICSVEAPDVAECEARLVAETEVGAEFVRRFLLGTEGATA